LLFLRKVKARQTLTAGVPGASDIAITGAGNVFGGTGYDGAAIQVGWGLDNTVQIDTGGQVIAGEGGNAIRFIADDASRTLVVANDGTLIGNVVGGATITAQSAVENSAEIKAATAQAAAEDLSIINSKNGVLNTAQMYQADIINDGQLVVGTRLNHDLAGDHDMQDLRVEGDLTQNSSGQLILASDFGVGQSDTVHVTGDVALDGTLDIEASTIVRDASVRLLTTDGSLAGAFSGVNSTLFSYELNQSAQSLEATVRNADFDQRAFGLTVQQSELAQHLEAIFYADDLGFETTFAALEVAAQEGSAALAQIYNSLSPQASLAGAAMNFKQTGVRLDELLSCDDFANGSGMQEHNTCWNLNLGGQSFDQTAKDEAMGYSGTITSMNVGGGVMLDSGAIVSVLFGYEFSDFNTDSSTSTAIGETAHIEVGLTQTWGNFSLSGALAASRGSFDTTRSIGMVGHSANAQGSYDATSTAGRIRAAYTFPSQNGFMRALVDLDVIHANTDGYTETGAGNLNLQVDSSSGTAYVFSPALEVERTRRFGTGNSLRTYGLFGVSFSSLESYSTWAQFADAQADGTSFGSDLAITPVSGRLSLGVQWLNDENLSLGAEYNLNFANGFEAHRAAVNLRWTF
jgi:uncharacterized protein with beta-barrel porin domain